MLETACFNASSAIAAAKAGADRLELCADYAAGGLTPALSTLHSIRDELNNISIRVRINVMIRPRGGDFNYSPAEFSQIKSNVGMFKASQAVDGFVLGILDSSGDVDRARNVEVVALAHPLPCTFHRAIDEVVDMEEAVETIIECGFKSILTSGGARNATEGAKKVAELHKEYGERISLILGGGIRSANVKELKLRTCVEWVHSAAVTGKDEAVDEEEVKKMVALLRDA